ncbi:MAG: hypothetical protein MZV63_64995 [Marinilabiliales bacterium]|nr:hypothetical protein [Marinilabiliales bacterium]
MDRVDISDERGQGGRRGRERRHGRIGRRSQLNDPVLGQVADRGLTQADEQGRKEERGEEGEP